MKYCCIKFEEASRRDKQSSPNIRIVKFLSEPKSTFKLSKDIEIHIEDEPKRSGVFAFFIMIGYAKFDFNVPMFNVDFCPFCGVNLYDFYSNAGDIKANEIEGETFSR